MLLPDNVQPELSIYYNGAIVLGELQAKPVQAIIDLYEHVRSSMSFQIFLLCLDWLYLIDAAKVNERGEVELCLSKN
ncbi:MAG: hypothetical protein KID02_10535 [Clostridiales bacterium]|nr:hypothetical protein [Clostridiales bacterium]